MAPHIDRNAEIRARLVTAIEARGLTPKEASIRAGFRPAYVGNMLRQGSGPTASRVVHLSRVLKVDFAWLACGIGVMFDEIRFRNRIALRLFDAIHAGRTSPEDVAAYVREELAPTEVTDDEIQAAVRMIADIWEEQDRAKAAKLEEAGQ